MLDGLEPRDAGEDRSCSSIEPDRQGNELPDGRISATFAIPNECVEEILARFGCNGTIIDLLGAAELKTFKHAKIELQSDMTMQHAIANVEELELALKKNAKCIIPTCKMLRSASAKCNGCGSHDCARARSRNRSRTSVGN